MSFFEVERRILARRDAKPPYPIRLPGRGRVGRASRVDSIGEGDEGAASARLFAVGISLRLGVFARDLRMVGNIHFHVLILDGVYVLGTDAENAVASRSSLMHEASKSAIPSPPLLPEALTVCAPDHASRIRLRGG